MSANPSNRLPVTPPRPGDALRVAVALWVLVALIVVVAVRNAPVVATGVWVRLTHEGEPADAFLRDAAQGILSASLDGVGPLRVLTPDAANHGPADVDVDSARAEAAALGASHVITGAVRTFGDSVSLSLTLREVDGARSRTVTATATHDGLPSLVDDLSARLAARTYGTRGSTTRTAEDVLSASLPALEAFYRAERPFRMGRYAQAGALYDRALRDDPGFALAHYRKALVAEHLDRQDLARTAAAAALEHGQGLGMRHRLLVEAHAAWLDGDLESAEAVLRRLVTAYPGAVAGRVQLAELLIHSASFLGLPITGAREAALDALAADPGNEELLMDAARVALAEQDDALFRRIADQALERAPDSPASEALALVAAAKGGREADFPDISTGVSDDALRAAARILATGAGDMEAAVSVAGALTQPHRGPRVRALGEVWQAMLHLARGRRAQAGQAFARAATLDPDLALEHEALAHTLPFLRYDRRAVAGMAARMERWRPGGARANEEPEPHYGLHLRSRPLFAPYLAGRLTLAVGDTAATSLWAVETRAVPAAAVGPPLQEALAAALDAAMAHGDGDPAEALRILAPAYDAMAFQLHQPSILVSLARERWQRAESLAAAGSTDEALRWFEPYWGLVPEAVFVAPSHFRRAQLREATGDPAGALQDYRSFLELWQDADAELQEWVGLARARVEALAGS